MGAEPIRSPIKRVKFAGDGSDLADIDVVMGAQPMHDARAW
jgi:hypothetical protein